jgi:hypothetical protein
MSAKLGPDGGEHRDLVDPFADDIDGWTTSSQRLRGPRDDFPELARRIEGERTDVPVGRQGAVDGEPGGLAVDTRQPGELPNRKRSRDDEDEGSDHHDHQDDGDRLEHDVLDAR